MSMQDFEVFRLPFLGLNVSSYMISWAVVTRPMARPNLATLALPAKNSITWYPSFRSFPSGNWIHDVSSTSRTHTLHFHNQDFTETEMIQSCWFFQFYDELLSGHQEQSNGGCKVLAAHHSLLQKTLLTRTLKAKSLRIWKPQRIAMSKQLPAHSTSPTGRLRSLRDPLMKKKWNR